MHFLLMNVHDKAILFSLPLSAAVKPAVLGTTYIENHCITVETVCINIDKVVVTYQIPFK